MKAVEVAASLFTVYATQNLRHLGLTTVTDSLIYTIVHISLDRQTEMDEYKCNLYQKVFADTLCENEIVVTLC